MSKSEDQLASHMQLLNLKYEREYKFHNLRRWRFDFAFPSVKLGIEVEGVTSQNWVGGNKKALGRHQRPAGYQADCEKYNSAIEDGWFVLRYTQKQVRTGEALAQIERMLVKLSNLENAK